MKKRIALVANTLSGGGAEKSCIQPSRGLAGYYDVDIIVNETSPMDYSHSGHVISLNIPTNPANESKWHQLRIVIKRIHVLRHLKRKRNMRRSYRSLICATFQTYSAVTDMVRTLFLSEILFRGKLMPAAFIG